MEWNRVVFAVRDWVSMVAWGLVAVRPVLHTLFLCRPL